MARERQPNALGPLGPLLIGPDGRALALGVGPSLPPSTGPSGPVNTVLPVVMGVLTVGNPLTTSDGTWTGSPTSFGYQWKSAGSNVGTNANTYTTVSGDVGHTITCTVSATNAGGTTPATSATVGPIANLPVPVNTVLPSVSGSVNVGGVLTTTDGTWTGSPTSFGYQWKSAGSNVGTNANTYTTVSGDIGHTITCTVSATNAGGTTPATSATVGPITGTPTTTNFQGGDAGIIYGGFFGPPFLNAGIMIKNATGTNSDFRTVITGTEALLTVFAVGVVYTWTVDGGATQTASPGGNVNAQITLFTGLTDAPHTVIVVCAGYVGYSPAFLTVTGATPALAAPANYSNNQYLMAGSSGVAIDGSETGVNAEGYPLVLQRGAARFKTSAAIIRAWCVNRSAPGPISLVRDGDPSTNAIRSVPDTWGWISWTGLDTSTEHTYRIINGPGTYLYSIMCDALNTSPLTPLPTIFFGGDSETAATNITNGDCALNFPQVFALLANTGYQILAGAGWQARLQGIANDGAPGAAVPTPMWVYMLYGVNDGGFGPGGLATWSASVTTILTQISTDLPTTPIVWPGIFPVSGTASIRVSYNAALVAAIAALANPLITYLDVESLATLPTSDGTHLTGGPTGSATTYGTFLAAHTP